MITILDRHGNRHQCYVDKSPPPRPPIAWLFVSQELKAFYRDMAAKGAREEFKQHLRAI